MEGLGVSLQGLIAQLINFILLLVILRAVAYKPIIRMLDERSARIRESMERAVGAMLVAAGAKPAADVRELKISAGKG